MLKRLLIVLTTLLSAACGQTLPQYSEELGAVRTFDVPAQSYTAAAWVAPDAIALSYVVLREVGHETHLVLVDALGRETHRFDMGVRPECSVRYFDALAQLGPHEFVVADTCAAAAAATDAATLLGVDIETGETRELGFAPDPPAAMSWRADGHATYMVGDHLCGTLFTHEPRQGEAPLAVEVEIDGDRFLAGQDRLGLPDRCPRGGRAGFPAWSPDARTLAFLASSNGQTPVGQGLLDRPWALITMDEGGNVVTRLTGIGDPGDLAWVSGGRALLFTGTLAGRRGLWTVDPDGSNLTLIAGDESRKIAPSPGGTDVMALQIGLPSEPTRISVFGLPDR